MPNRRTPEEIRRSFEMAKKMAERSRVKENQISVRYAKNSLLILASIQMLIAFYYFMSFPLLMVDIGIEFFIGAVFLVLYFYAKTEPVRAFVIAISVYGGIIIIMALLNPLTIFGAIFLKAIVIAILATGLRAAKKLPKPKKEPTEVVLDDDF